VRFGAIEVKLRLRLRIGRLLDDFQYNVVIIYLLLLLCPSSTAVSLVEILPTSELEQSI